MKSLHASTKEVQGLSKWRKLKDRKPRRGQRCLVLVADTGHIMDAYYYSHWVGGFCDGKDSGHAVKGVSDWIPYPR